MKFISGIKIDISKVPAYKPFSVPWTEPLDYDIIGQLLDIEEDWNKPELRSLVRSSIANKINKKTGQLVSKHYQAFTKDGKGYGRFYPTGYHSLAVMPRHYKHTVYSLLGWRDLDMKSAHPTIIYETFKSQGDILLAYGEYLQNKETITEELLKWYDDPENPVLKAEDIKFLFNLTTFGGSHNTWINYIENEPWPLLSGEPDPNWEPREIYKKESHPFYTRYFEDTELAREKISEANSGLRELALESRKKKTAHYKSVSEYDVQTTTMSVFCSIIENDILFIAYKCLLELGIMKARYGSPEMDGLNIPPPECGWDKVDDESVLTEINDKVLKESKLAVKFVWKGYKAENIHLTKEQIKKPSQESDEMDIGIPNDMAAARVVFDLHPHWVCCNNELFVFNPSTGMWDNNITSHRTIISKYASYLYVMEETEKTGIKKSLIKSYGNTLSLMDKIPPLIKTLCVDDNWFKTSQYSSLGKILFLNGYYDFRKSLFYSKEEHGFDPKIVFTGKIHHNFEEFSAEDMEYMESVKQRLFYNALGEEVGNYQIMTLARGLAGDMMKRIVFGLGATNTGKGVLTSALMLSCGDYIGSFNAENLAYRQSSNDEAQIMRWALLLRNKRIIISNELKSTVDLNGNMIKKICSGGDSLIGRNHGGVETEFITHFLPVVLANDLPDIKPFDDAVRNRMRVIGYEKSYVDNPTNEFELKNDDNIKEEVKTLRFKRVFVGILIQAYLNFVENGEPAEPEAVLKAKEDWTDQEKNVIDTFCKDYEITNNPEDWVRSSEIGEWINDKKLGITIKKFSSELKKYCTIKGKTNVASKDKCLGKKTLKCWFGITRLIETDPDLDNSEGETTP